VTAGQQGNRERVAFLYDERKVKFGGLAGEVVLPPAKKGVPAFQISRTPYIVGFKAGWFSFTICSTHLFYGEDKADDPQRLKEMDLLAGFLAAEVKRSTAWSRNMILLGDFNVFTTADAQYKVLTEKHGFTVPKTMVGKATNTGANRPYDQIAFIAPALTDQLALSKSGVFPFFDHVFTDADEPIYAPAMGDGYLRNSKGKVRTAKEATTYYRQWRTHQMSDHNPLWIELRTDFSEAYLKQLAKP
jgi:endonuclease/exonuclease/phosphatase family metal-dependent hydrolase